MGLQDRDYYRENPPDGFDLRGGWSMTTWIIVVTSIVFVANMITTSPNAPFGWLLGVLEARPASLLKPYLWWQLVTYGFAHDSRDIAHIFWNMFGLWIFGKAVEDIYGPKEFLRFYVLTIFLGGLVWTARQCALAASDPETWAVVDALRWELAGASGAVTAVTMLFCIHYPTQIIRLMLVLPVPAWFVGAMIIFGNIFGALQPDSRVAFDVHLVGAAFAILYYKLGLNLGRWVPDISFSKRFWKRRPKLRVHQPVEDTNDSFDELARRADVLYDKINQHGIDSLTASERQTLDEHSRQVREKRRRR